MIRRYISLALTVPMAFLIGLLIVQTFLQVLILLGFPVEIHGISHGPHFRNWALVAFSVLFFAFFTLGYAVPQGRRDWRSMGLLQAFLIALYTEMFGFPLTIFILSSYFGYRLSESHESGHLLAQFLKGVVPLDFGVNLVMTISYALMALAFLLIFLGWQKIHAAKGRLVTDGIYYYLRHPQYLGFFLLTLSFLIHWPTILTLIMWPILLFSYWRLALWEERQAEEEFGEAYLFYKQRTPAIFPRILKRKI